MANLVGKTLGKYKLTERLGKGGMAEVYKAYHPKLERYVTIKILHSYLAEGEDFLARFEREARAVASLRHPHIVQIHDFDIENEQYYMVMEFIDGGSLENQMMELAKSGAYMPAGKVLTILQQVAEALDYAHKRGIIHRDIKPSNILLDLTGNAFLSDFGIARMMSGTQFTATGSLIGTPTYMSPEQGRGDELTTVSDIYSLGVILYELLTGKVPFTSDTTPLAIIHKHIHEPPPNPRALRPDLPEAVEQVIFKAMAKNPKERYQSAKELVQALEKALPAELIAELDSSRAQAFAPVSTLPTMLEEEPSAADRAQLQTAAIGEETRAEMVGLPPAVGAATPQPAGFEKSGEQREVSASPAREKKSGRREKPAEGKKRSRSLLVVIVVIAVILIAVLAIGLSGLFSGPSCSTIDDCVVLHDERKNQGDLDGSLDAIDKAISLVPPEDQQAFAWIWCEKTLLLEQMGRMDEANESRSVCEIGNRPLPPCPTIEECLFLYDELKKQGKVEDSLAAIDKAISLVPPEEHQSFAHIWCEKALQLDQMGRVDEANESRNICAVWKRGE